MRNTAKKTTDNHKSKPSEYLLEEEKLNLSRDSNLYGGIYKELAELLGDTATTKIWKHFKGVTVTFPMHLMSRCRTREFIKEHMNTEKPIEIAREVGLSERRVRQIIRELKEEMR